MDVDVKIEHAEAFEVVTL